MPPKSRPAQKGPAGSTEETTWSKSSQSSPINGILSDVQKALILADEKVKSLEMKTKILENQNMELQIENSELQEAFDCVRSQYKKETMYTYERCKDKDAEILKLRSQYKKETMYMYERCKDKDAEILKLRESVTKKDETIRQLKERVTNLTSEKDIAIRYLQDLEKINRKKEALEKELQRIKVQKEYLEKDFQYIKDDRENQGDRKLHEASAKIIQKEHEIKEKEKQHYKLVQRKEELCKVVGANIGANIMNDNPNIADLSYENRPTKLAEKFSELYDNEWTDAYEDAKKEFPTEKEAIGYPYKTLQDVFEFCKTMSEEHAKKIKACVLTVPSASSNGRPTSAQIGVTNQRQLNELRRSIAPYLVDSVFQHFLGTTKVNVSNKKRLEAFLKKSVEICWLMNSQDPPVILDKTGVNGKDFDGNRYKTYTKSGKVVDFVVWPPMLLHQDGPLLCKGVAQCK